MNQPFTSWKQIACAQGQRRLSNETRAEFKRRVMKLFAKRRKNEQTLEWRKESAH